MGKIYDLRNKEGPEVVASSWELLQRWEVKPVSLEHTQCT